jgi:porin
MNKTPRNNLTLLAALICVASGTTSQAADDPPEGKSATMQFLERDYLLGDWGGFRTDLSKRGVDLEFVWFGALANNVSGGIKVGSEWEGALLMMMNLNSDKLVGYHGGTFAVSSLYIHNTREFSRFHIGDLNKVSLLDFPDSLRLWELYYEQKLWHDRVSIKAGQLAIDRDFILPEFYNSLAGITFLNQTFFYPTLAFNVWDVAGLRPGHHALASTPYGAPGARLRVDPSPRWVAQVGVYDGLPDTGWGGTRINLNEAEGALIYGEVGYRRNQAEGDTGLKGNIKVGVYYHTDEFDNIDDAVSAAFGLIPVGSIGENSGNFGVYGLIDHQLYREMEKDDPASQGLVGFFRVAGAPPDRNLTQFGIDGGLVYKGLIPTRDWDTLGVAASYLEMSDDLGSVYKSIGRPAPDYEAVIELSYKAQLTAWWTLQPSLQYVFHPGGRTDPTRTIDDALAILLQTSLRF